MATPHFPKATLEKMKRMGMSEADALDVFNSGEYHSTSTGRPVITAVWKRKII